MDTNSNTYCDWLCYCDSNWLCYCDSNWLCYCDSFSSPYNICHKFIKRIEYIYTHFSSINDTLSYLLSYPYTDLLTKSIWISLRDFICNSDIFKHTISHSNTNSNIKY